MLTLLLVAGLPTDERILTIVKALLGNNVRGGGSKLNMKLAHVGSPVHWHQDWAFCASHGRSLRCRSLRSPAIAAVQP